ncbi:PD-(D/E)XK motif protein [Candidatus Foliamicus sp.]
MTNDPWADIEISVARSQISARRIPGTGSTEWGLYWGVDAAHRYLLILQRSSRPHTSHRLPKLKGLSVEELVTDNGTRVRIIIRLTDSEQREIFHRFCLDIVEATRLARTADEAHERYLARTLRWHRLLTTGRDGRLSADEQKGLIGEFRVIEQYLLGISGARDALMGWTGPLGSPKDFEVGLATIEAKARSPQSSEVRISSIDQLDLAGATRLFLSVTEVAAASRDFPDSVTISDLAARVRSSIKRLDLSATALFEERVAAVGFDWEDDYTDKRWSIGSDVLYEVTSGFPKITPSMVSPAIHDVSYSLRLSSCESFRVPTAALVDAISGEADES